MAAFSPIPLGTYRVTVGASPVSVTLPSRPTTMRVLNATAANLLYLEVNGTAAVPAAGGAVGSMPIAGGAGSIPVLIEKGNSTSVSLIASGADTDVYITLGLGDTVG